MRNKWPSLSLLLIALLTFVSFAFADEKVIEKVIELDDESGKKVVVKIVSDENDCKDLKWISEGDDIIVIHGDQNDSSWHCKPHGSHEKAGNDFHIQMMSKKSGPYLGVTLSDIDEEEARDAGLRKSSGVRIMSVIEDSAAEVAGLEAGDIVTRFDGRKIDDADELVEAVGESEIGDKVKIKIMRDGKKKTLACVLGEHENDLAFFDDDQFHKQKMLKKFDIHNARGEDDIFVKRILGSFPHGPRLGVEIRNLEKSMAGYFPGSETGQVLVMGITENSLAEEVGVQPGDIITRFDGQSVSNSDALREAVQDAEPDVDIKLGLLRQGKTLEFTLRFDEQKSGLAEFITPRLKKIQGLHSIKEDDLEKRLKILELKLEELSRKLN